MGVSNSLVIIILYTQVKHVGAIYNTPYHVYVLVQVSLGARTFFSIPIIVGATICLNTGVM